MKIFTCNNPKCGYSGPATDFIHLASGSTRCHRCNREAVRGYRNRGAEENMRRRETRKHRQQMEKLETTARRENRKRDRIARIDKKIAEKAAKKAAKQTRLDQEEAIAAKTPGGRKAWRKARRGEVKNIKLAFIANLRLEKGCKRCGLKATTAAIFEFHHRNPKLKLGSIRTLIQRGYSLNTIVEEINKCDILCANCHRAEHA